MAASVRSDMSLIISQVMMGARVYVWPRFTVLFAADGLKCSSHVHGYCTVFFYRLLTCDRGCQSQKCSWMCSTA